jgi:uncharacterized membrane protein SpoIIM required for sporulation
MREQQFIEQNKEKWREFESLMEDEAHDPERLGQLFVQITDDLSYARTFYPNRSVRVYLNDLAQQVFHKLYRTRKRKRNRLTSLFSDEIPSAVYHARRELLVSLIVFTVAVCCGILSGMKNPEFARTILSDAYIEMTEENIAGGDPMAVYKGDNQFYVFAYIAFNNLRIDFYTFVSGLFFGIWTILMLIYNGVMVGAFQYFFAERGFFSESFLAIWMHGTLELSAAVIAGGAGLILGRGLVFPGTYSRLQSLIISARQGLKVLMIALAMTTLAAVIESFLTRYTGIPNAVRLVFILSSFAFVIGYFIILPWRKYLRGTIAPKESEKLLPDLNQEIALDEIKGVGRLFSEGYVIYRGYFRRYLPWAVVVAALYTVVNIVFNYALIREGFNMYAGTQAGPLSPVVWTFTNLGNLFSTGYFSAVNLSNILLTGISLSMVLLLTRRQLLEKGLLPNDKATARRKVTGALTTGIVLALLISLMFNVNPWMSSLVIAAAPILIATASGIYLDGSEIHRAASAGRGSGLKIAGVYLSALLIGTLLFTLITFFFFSLCFWMGSILFGREGMDANKIFISLYVFCTSLAVMLILPSIVNCLVMAYFNGKETVTAKGLKTRLARLADNSDEAK